jgi:hypothetical protein
MLRVAAPEPSSGAAMLQPRPPARLPGSQSGRRHGAYAGTTRPKRSALEGFATVAGSSSSRLRPWSQGWGGRRGGGGGSSTLSLSSRLPSGGPSYANVAAALARPASTRGIGKVRAWRESGIFVVLPFFTLLRGAGFALWCRLARCRRLRCSMAASRWHRVHGGAGATVVAGVAWPVAARRTGWGGASRAEGW